MRDFTAFRSRPLWLAVVALLLASCVRIGAGVAPVSQYVLAERSLQAELYQTGLWTLSFDYRFEAQTAPDSARPLQIDSTLTLHNPGVKHIRITIIFIDAENRVLGTDTLLDVESFPTNPLVPNRRFNSPAGTVAIAFNSSTQGFRPVD